jgi:hypothetical protein
MKSDKFKYFSYSELDRNHVRETIKQDLVKILGDMPESTNDHKKVSPEYRMDRIMECIDIMRNPASTPEERSRAIKKKYKLLHPDKTNEEQNSRRRRLYATNDDYRAAAIAHEKQTREMNQKYLEEKRQTSIEWGLSLRREAIARAGGQCVICGCKDHSLMDFHHTRPENKLFNVNATFSKRNKEMFYDEIDKCVLLCRPCHNIVTRMQRYLEMCEIKNQPLNIFIEILRDKILNGLTCRDIAFKINLPEVTVERIVRGEFFDDRIADVKQQFEAEKAQRQQELQGEYKELPLLHTEMPPPLPPQLPLPVPPPQPIDFETPANLEALRRIQVFNRKHGNRCGRIAVPPVQFAQGITPYNLNQMDVCQGELEPAYSIPGAQWVTPFDFNECED